MSNAHREIAELIRQGRKIEAIKLLREETGIDLERAKEEIDRLSAGLAPQASEPPTTGTRSAEESGELSAEVEDLARRGKKIDAIALHRKQTGMSLKESKETIERVTGIRGGGCLPGLLISILVLAGAVSAASSGCVASIEAAETEARVPCFEASDWPAADSLFQRDPNWVGADGAYSIDLGQDRTLWLFGDSWVDPSGRHTRHGARMIRNSVGIQTGSNPSQAAMKFYWNQTPAGEPTDFFTSEGETWYWPGHGVRLGDRLLLFLMRIRSSEGGLGFESDGWNAVLVHNPDDPPSEWRSRPLETPPNELGVVIGSASVLSSEGHVYAFGSRESVTSHPMYLVRWPADAASGGDLGEPEWWAGADTRWIPNTSLADARPVFDDGQTELTVHFDSVSQRFQGVQHVGFGPADLTLRAAPELTGPWSEPHKFYRPAEYNRPNIMIYAAKAHPQLAGADLVVTYATNTFEFREHLSDSLIYYPHFVRLARCR